MNKTLLATVAVALVTVPSFAQHTTSNDQLVGTWKVVILKAMREVKVTYSLGD